MTQKLYIKTYGCQMNVYDTKRMTDVLAPLGFERTEDPADAHLVILNTCHIREKAAEKVYSDIGRIRLMKEKRLENNGDDMVIAVAGCVAQAEGAEIMRRQPVVDMVLGPQTYHRLPDMLEKVAEQKKERRTARVMDTDFPTESKFDHLPEEKVVEGPASFLSVQEGCDKFCTFCVVPYTRGAEFSRPVEQIEEEARRLVELGVVEVTLLGQNVNAYHGTSKAGNTVSLAELIARLDKIEGLERIRYTTSHPRDMQDDLIDAHGEIASLMPYLHLPIQSGSNAILEAMNRKHTTDRYYDIIERLRKARPDISLSSDFIVGFPGETDADFEDTMTLVDTVKYGSAYSFKYSPRPGTPASVMETQVDEAVKAERLARLQDLINQQQFDYNKAAVGQTMRVLLERPSRDVGFLAGRSPYMQAVHMDVRKMLDGKPEEEYTSLIGQFAEVKITGAGPNSLQGELV